MREREIQPSFWMHRDVSCEGHHLFGHSDRIADIDLLRSKLKKIRSDFSDLRHRFGTRELRDPSLESPTDLREIAADSGDYVLFGSSRPRDLTPHVVSINVLELHVHQCVELDRHEPRRRALLCNETEEPTGISNRLIVRRDYEGESAADRGRVQVRDGEGEEGREADRKVSSGLPELHR